MQDTNNDWDREIIGLKGRAVMLRNQADSLKLDTDNIVPSEEELDEKMQAQAELNALQFKLNQLQGRNGVAGAPEGKGGVNVPPPHVIDKAGGIKGRPPAATMQQAGRVRH